jgi:hypothetical protein
VITINEARRELGYKPLPKDFVWGDMPLDFAVIYYQAIAGAEISSLVDNDPGGNPISRLKKMISDISGAEMDLEYDG